MGKYMRKAKVVVSGEVVAAAVMELAAAPLGVRTRARSLALQKRQGGEYLELRSRRLEKLPPPPPPPPRRRATAAAATADATATESAEAEVSFGGENVLELEAMERWGFSLFLLCDSFFVFRGFLGWIDWGNRVIRVQGLSTVREFLGFDVSIQFLHRKFLGDFLVLLWRRAGPVLSGGSSARHHRWRA